MPWSGASGSQTFSRTDGTRSGAEVWQEAHAAGVKIVPDDHDAHDQDLANGINACLKKDGGNTATADIPMGGNRIVNSGLATDRAHLAVASQVQDSSMIWGGTATGTADAITLTLSPAVTSYATGLRVSFRAASANTGPATVNINSVGAVAITKWGTTALGAGDIAEDRIHTIEFDGAQFQLLDPVNPIETISGTAGALTKTGSDWALDDLTTTIFFARNNSGNVIPTGFQGDISCDFDCEITGVRLLGNPQGSLVIDLWKDTYANFPPTDADSITSASPPTLSNATKYEDTTLTNWTTSISAGDIIRVNVDSASTVTAYTLAIRVKRFG